MNAITSSLFDGARKNAILAIRHALDGERAMENGRRAIASSELCSGFEAYGAAFECARRLGTADRDAALDIVVDRCDLVGALGKLERLRGNLAKR